MTMPSAFGRRQVPAELHPATPEPGSDNWFRAPQSADSARPSGRTVALLATWVGGLRAGRSTLAPATGKLGLQRIQWLGEGVGEVLQPGHRSVDAGRVDGVDALPTGRMHGDQPDFQESLQMLRSGRLGDPVPDAQRLGDLPGRPVTVAEQLEDVPPDRVAERLEDTVGRLSVHPASDPRRRPSDPSHR